MNELREAIHTQFDNAFMNQEGIPFDNDNISDRSYVNAILDAVIAALPKDIGSYLHSGGEDTQAIESGYNMAINRIKRILESSKESK